MPPRSLLSFKNVSLLLHGAPLLDELSLSVFPGQVLALIGANGCGKSTLLKLIASSATGRSEIDTNAFEVTGEIHLAPRTEAVYLPQMLRDDGGIEAIASTSILDLSHESRLRREFGLEKSTDTEAMSDGELQKAGLVRALLAEGDLYLFDEPTNYLDIAGLTAFEDHLERLKRSGRGVILVTHDRTLTDHLADQTVLLSRYGIFHTNGGASEARSLSRQDFESRRHLAESLRRKIAQLQQDARTRAGWAEAKEKQKRGAGGAKPHISRLSAKMAKRAKAVARRAEKEVERLEATKPHVPKQVSLHIPRVEIRRRQVFSLEEVGFSYTPASSLLSDITLAATTRDKICLMGANGSGKSTLLKVIRGELAAGSGERRFNRNVAVASIPQGLAGFFKNGSLLDNMRECGHDETTIRQYLGAALLRKDKTEAPIGNFSYGELMRAAFVKCLLMRAEFMFLDEPTSHLDIESIEVLEQLAQDFGGGFLLISHDRSFVENVAETLYVLDAGRLRLV